MSDESGLSMCWRSSGGLDRSASAARLADRRSRSRSSCQKPSRAHTRATTAKVTMIQRRERTGMKLISPRESSMAQLCSFRVAALCALAFIGLAAGRLAAQDAPPGLVEVHEGSRRGFWFGLGLGAGGESNDVTGSGYSDPFYQPTFSLRAGGTVNPHLRLG